MAAQILDGRALAATMRQQLGPEVERLVQAGRPPSLVSLQIGQSDPSRAYIQSQRRACVAHGILYNHVSLDEGSPEQHVLAHIAGICENPSVTGLIIQLPVPERLDMRRAYEAMDPLKDVEGMHPANLGSVFSGERGLQPCTALAVLSLIRASGAQLRGAEVCVIGHSGAVGKPIGMLLLAEDATVTTCHVHTKDLADKTRQADVLVVAAGKPGLVGKEHIRPGACVIDVGINYLEGGDRPVGDVRFDEASEVAGWITPVPGGVGPMTVAVLLRNTVRAAKAQLEAEERLAARRRDQAAGS